MRRVCGVICGVAALAMASGAALSEELRLGIGNEPTSIDPNFYNFPQNHAVADHWAETLVLKDHKQRATPLLAESWRTLPGDDKVWEFKLRKGVKFTDGSAFTADDVLFTNEYALTIKTSSPVGRYQQNKKITKVDDYTLHITTGTPYPLMVKEMAMVHVVSKKTAQGKTTEDYNKGRANSGTGPYKFVEWTQGDRIVFEPNPDYWGSKPKWSKVTFRPIKSDPSRVAALLSGAVDIIDNVPTTDLTTLRKNPKVAVSEISSNRVIYLFPDLSRHVSPFAKSNDGQPLMPNPLRDWRVRKALSLAIDRKAMVSRLMEGAAIAAGQMSPDFIFGHYPKLKPAAYDAKQAKALLAQAGYPDGFKLTIHGPNDRYVNDEKILETVAQMYARVGVKTDVVAMPKATFFGRAARGGPGGSSEFSLFMIGSGSNLGDGCSQIQNSHVTNGTQPNMGRLNWNRYSNPIVDAILVKSAAAVDVKKRESLCQEANEIIMMDHAMIPLHYQMNFWAHRPDLTYPGHTNEKTKAMLVSKK